MKYKFLAIFLLISMILSANSIFSYYGMANQYLGNDLYSAGMSDAGENDLFRINTSYSNPAILTSSNKVIFSTATSFGKQNYYDDNGKLVIVPQKIDCHKVGKKTIPSGFFFQPNSEYVSAVLFSASGTISKFNRIGRQAGFAAKDIIMIRVSHPLVLKIDHST
jgi:hypothetical protein